MTTDLKTAAENLLRDVDTLCTAFDSLGAAIQRVAKRYPDDHIQLRPSIEFAAWAASRFSGDWERFEQFTRDALDQTTRDKSQLWMLDSPQQQDPDADADRHLDRIDIALHLVTKELGMELPFKTVRDHGWHQRNHLQRIQAFAKSLTDVLQ